MINDPITSTNYCHPIYKILRFFSFFNYKINVGIVIGWTNRIDPKKKNRLIERVLVKTIEYCTEKTHASAVLTNLGNYQELGYRRSLNCNSVRIF